MGELLKQLVLPGMARLLADGLLAQSGSVGKHDVIYA